MLMLTLRQSDAAVVACVFDTPDRISHMFWRQMESSTGAAADWIHETYRKMDEILGEVRAAMGDDTLLLVISDHGFTRFDRAVDLNAWLLESGYLRLKGPREAGKACTAGDIDWDKTVAFASGLAGVYLNVKGRYRCGVVEPSCAAALAAEIKFRLESLMDTVGGMRAVREVIVSGEAFIGPYRQDGPDLIVGYEAGYRCSWRSAAGEVGEAVFHDNDRAWSGDHCVHPAVVPGVLASNVAIDSARASMLDIGPSVLEALGIEAPPAMQGRSLWRRL